MTIRIKPLNWIALPDYGRYETQIPSWYCVQWDGAKQKHIAIIKNRGTHYDTKEEAMDHCQRHYENMIVNSFEHVTIGEVLSIQVSKGTTKTV